MRHDAAIPRLLSLRAVARRLAMPHQRVQQAHSAGVLIPDFVADRAALFMPHRLEEIEGIIRTHTRGHHSISR